MTHIGWGDDIASYAEAVPWPRGGLVAYFDEELQEVVIDCSCSDVCIAGSEDCIRGEGRP